VVIEQPATEDGGLLPNTATPWFNYLIVGSLITAAGALGFRKFALSNK
jgi:LPXTG-motif cell wall-anchored protein